MLCGLLDLCGQVLDPGEGGRKREIKEREREKREGVKEGERQ